MTGKSLHWADLHEDLREREIIIKIHTQVETKIRTHLLLLHFTNKNEKKMNFYDVMRVFVIF